VCLFTYLWLLTMIKDDMFFVRFFDMEMCTLQLLPYLGSHTQKKYTTLKQHNYNKHCILHSVSYLLQDCNVPPVYALNSLYAKQWKKGGVYVVTLLSGSQLFWAVRVNILHFSPKCSLSSVAALTTVLEPSITLLIHSRDTTPSCW